MSALKRYFPIFVLSALLCINTVFVRAETDVPEVGGGSFSIASVRSSAFSVDIKGNSGIMGFKFTLQYDTSSIKISAVERGSVTKAGNFSTNFDNAGEIIAVWNNTESVSADGSLFNVKYDVLDNGKDTEIKIAYSQNDTFNGKYEAVVLEVRSIVLTGSKETGESAADEPEYIPDTQPDISPGDKTDYGGIVRALKELFDKYDTDNLSEEETRSLLSEAGAAVDRVSGTTGQKFESLEALKFFYDQIRINLAEDVISDEDNRKKAEAVIKKRLDKNKADSVDKLSESEKDALADEIKQLLTDKDDILKEITNDEWIEAVKQKGISAENREKPEGSRKGPFIYLIIPIAAAVISVLIIKMRRDKNEKGQ